MKAYIITLITLLTFGTVTLSAQRIEYKNHTSKGARILESDIKKVARLDKSSRDLYMWAGLASLDVKGTAIYSLKIMYTAAYRVTVKEGDPLVLTLKNGEEIVLRSKASVESKGIEGVETVFASYEIKEADLIEVSRVGIIKVAPTLTCFGESSFSKELNMWKLARPLSLRYEMLREYIEKNPE